MVDPDNYIDGMMSKKELLCWSFSYSHKFIMVRV